MTNSGAPRYSAASVDAIVQAYYARATGSPDTARGRAQAAYGIASALAGGLVAAAVISRFSSAQDVVQVLGMVAIALWLAATSLYLYAVAVPVQLRSSTSEAQGSTEFVKAVVERAVTERESVDRRQKRANVLSALAMGATFVTFALGIFLPSRSFYATVTLSPTSGPTGTTCLGKRQVVIGEVVTASLQLNLVEIHGAKVCGETVETLYVGRQRIVEIRSTNKKQSRRWRQHAPILPSQPGSRLGRQPPVFS